MTYFFQDIATKVESILPLPISFVPIFHGIASTLAMVLSL
jgi:hypothetical protein